MENSIILRTLIDSNPVLGDAADLRPVMWVNDKRGYTCTVLPEIDITLKDIMEAEERWKRFAPLIEILFPETKDTHGKIESRLVEIFAMKEKMENIYGTGLEGRLYLKCDNELPVAGSIKARGGIYEVFKHAESLAIGSGMLKQGMDYSVMAESRFRDFFGSYSIAVGSTGNLGLSIGIAGAALGFKVTVHMSADAKRWKKDILRRNAVTVVEHSSDYNRAVEEGRRESSKDPRSYFVDDERSVDLFLGYSTAALRLKEQLVGRGITIDSLHPLFVYIPCGVGGAPGGICFGLRHVFGDNVHCFFAEPTHSPCMFLALASGEYENVSVKDLGLDNRTEADGLAVGRASALAGRIVDRLVSGIYTLTDHEMYAMLAALRESEKIMVEPSAAAGLPGIIRLYGTPAGEAYIKKTLKQCRPHDAVHVVWATGGLFVPRELMDAFYEKGKGILNNAHGCLRQCSE